MIIIIINSNQLLKQWISLWKTGLPSSGRQTLLSSGMQANIAYICNEQEGILLKIWNVAYKNLHNTENDVY